MKLFGSVNAKKQVTKAVVSLRATDFSDKGRTSYSDVGPQID